MEAITVSLPLSKTVWASGLRITERDFLVVRLRTSSGRCGYGFHKSRGVTLDRIVRDNLAQLVIGKSPWEVERIWEDMYRATLFSGRVGAVMRALGTVDIALWDLRAQLAGVPLHRLLGGYRSQCRILLVTGYYEEDPLELGPLSEDIEYHATRGIDFFKIAAGMLDLAGDTRRIAEARREVGDAARSRRGRQLGLVRPQAGAARGTDLGAVSSAVDRRAVSARQHTRKPPVLAQSRRSRLPLAMSNRACRSSAT